MILDQGPSLGVQLWSFSYHLSWATLTLTHCVVSARQLNHPAARLDNPASPSLPFNVEWCTVSKERSMKSAGCCSTCKTWQCLQMNKHQLTKKKNPKIMIFPTWAKEFVLSESFDFPNRLHVFHQIPFEGG